MVGNDVNEVQFDYQVDSGSVEPIGRYKAYPEYKDPGVAWLGEIPSGWKLIKLKYVAELVGYKTNNNNSNYVGLENIESKTGRYLVTEKIVPESVSNTFKSNNILFGKLRPYLAKSWLASFSGICSSEFLVLDSQLVYPKFLNYFTLTEGFIEEVNSSTYGTKMPRASWDFIALVSVPVMDYTLSKKIANFLDHETAKIDTLIEKQRRLIELLTEKRQAVISHAVTKGLNPNVPMKDSGVEWLGEVPEHWEVSPLKLYIDTRKGVAFKSADFTKSGIRVVKASDIKNKTIRTSDVFLPKNYDESYPKAILNAGDIILSTVGSTPEVKNSAVGQIGLVPDGLKGSLLNQNTVVFNPKNKALLNSFLFYLLQIDTYRDHLDLNAHGTANQASLNVSDMLNFSFARPPVDEQSEIARHIENKSKSFDSLEVAAQQAIQLMQERRTALISSAVTGKIDVRDWVKPE